MKQILIVDDLEVNRKLLKQMLSSFDDFNIVEAGNGIEAIACVDESEPDLILMDLMMPEMDGYQATNIIKEKSINTHIPIIFITALDAKDALTDALASGGDDFIGKPFDIDMLHSKVTAHLRIRELNQQLLNTNKSLLKFSTNLIRENELIEYFFEKSIQQSYLDENIIRYHMSAMSTFNGDLLLVERGVNGGLYLIMGDFSGHGLTAAMGTLPVAMIFFSMVKENRDVSDIATEINFQLNKLLPSGMFFSAVVMELNVSSEKLTLWMGGMPEIFRFSGNGDYAGDIESKYMPLGILGKDDFDSSCQVLDVKPDDKLYIYSDGITEARNTQGDYFSVERLKKTLLETDVNRFDNVLNAVNEFTLNNDQTDDVSFIELTCTQIDSLKLEENKIIDSTLEWNLSFDLSLQDMKLSNPISQLSNALCSMPHVYPHKSSLLTLLTEIYTNALEHSILQLKSEIKLDSENFWEYQKIRGELLAKLDYAEINFKFRFYIENKTHNLEIEVSDSGVGYEERVTPLSEKAPFGRGLSIIHSLSHKVSFSPDGKTLSIIYRLL